MKGNPKKAEKSAHNVPLCTQLGLKTDKFLLNYGGVLYVPLRLQFLLAIDKPK